MPPARRREQDGPRLVIMPCNIGIDFDNLGGSSGRGGQKVMDVSSPLRRRRSGIRAVIGLLDLTDAS